MRIAICVKEVPDPTAEKRIDAGTNRLVRSGENTLNPYDRHAIEAAVQIKEGPAPDAEITIVTLGPESANRSVDRALAQGGDQSVHIADEAAAGSDLLGTARILAAALKRGRATATTAASGRAPIAAKSLRFTASALWPTRSGVVSPPRRKSTPSVRRSTVTTVRRPAGGRSTAASSPGGTSRRGSRGRRASSQSTNGASKRAASGGVEPRL